MKKRVLTFGFVALALLLVSNAAFAQQDRRNALIGGQKVISGGFNKTISTGGINGSTLGFGFMLSDNFQFVTNVGFGISSRPVFQVELDDEGKFDGKDSQDDASSTVFDLRLSPTFKFFTSTTGQATPFFYAQLDFAKRWDGLAHTYGGLKKAVNERSDYSASDNDPRPEYNPNEGFRLSAEAGFGVEVFIVPRFSFGGSLGLRANILKPVTPTTTAGTSNLNNAQQAQTNPQQPGQQQPGQQQPNQGGGGGATGGTYQGGFDLVTVSGTLNATYYF